MIINIVSIDVGTKNLGICLLSFDIEFNHISTIKFINFDAWSCCPLRRCDAICTKTNAICGRIIKDNDPKISTCKIHSSDESTSNLSDEYINPHTKTTKREQLYCNLHNIAVFFDSLFVNSAHSEFIFKPNIVLLEIQPKRFNQTMTSLYCMIESYFILTFTPNDISIHALSSKYKMQMCNSADINGINITKRIGRKKVAHICAHRILKSLNDGAFLNNFICVDNHDISDAFLQCLWYLQRTFKFKCDENNNKL